ncbi:MAG: hypothetical protein FRX48_08126 [Lasallia pustulata]|uniref:Uncharacterized protein n=1 Tax=Lasallia pustulata TaxID=136370 RepID=A0A5M8PHV5_9LECA|nr:MAG: hypothetical protein FRX48_08126 [Lasallia pustulata]
MASKDTSEYGLEGRLQMWPRKPPRYAFKRCLDMASKRCLDMALKGALIWPREAASEYCLQRRFNMLSKAALIYPQKAPRYGLEKPPPSMAPERRLDTASKRRLRIWH